MEAGNKQVNIHDELIVDEHVDALSAISHASISEIDFELLEKPGNRTTKLLTTSGDVKPVDGRRRWHEFKFRSSILVTSVTVETVGYLPNAEFEVGWVDETGASRDGSFQLDAEGRLTFLINQLCAGIGFKPPSVFFGNPKIQSVRIEGVARENIPAALEALSNIERHKKKASEVIASSVAAADLRIKKATQADAERAAAQRDTANLKQTAARVRKSVDDLARTKNELIVENSEAVRSSAESKSRLTDLESSNAT